MAGVTTARARSHAHHPAHDVATANGTSGSVPRSPQNRYSDIEV